MRHAVVWSALLLYALTLFGAAASRSGPAPRPMAEGTATATATLPTTRPPLPEGQVLGFALNFHHTDRMEDYFRAVDEIAGLGFNSVEVLTPAFQTNGSSDHIRVEVGTGLSPSREDLVALLKHARGRGLRTFLMPIVLLSDPRGNEWRGRIQPERWEPWWASYRETLDYFLDVANEADASVFSVGSELLSTEKPEHLDRWTALIAHVRERFHGRLSYSTNWDHYETPGFWKQLDMIGINGYWDLTAGTGSEHPGHEALVKRWRGIRDDVLAFGASQGMPVLLTEIGYPSLPWGLKDPWNYVNSSEAKPDPEAQAEGYRAFLAAWDDLLVRHPTPAKLRGVFFYKWDPYFSGGPDDTGYGVRGKPAYDLLRQWLEARAAAQGS